MQVIKKSFSLLAIFMCCHVAISQSTSPLIFDTDMGPDYDDVGAITLVHAFADSNKIDLLATIASTKYPEVAGVLSVLNTYFNRSQLPIGVPGGKAITQKDWQHWTDTLLAKYPHAIEHNQDAQDAVMLYRRLLSKARPKSVIILTVGFLTNLSNLLQSPPDSISNLSGVSLVKKRVKRLVCMAGNFPAGNEFNIREDAAASKYTFEHWPGEIIFSGFEIGQQIKTGLPLVQNNLIENSPVKDVFRICLPLAKEDSAGRMSWDQTAVLVAIAGVKPFYNLKAGRIIINADGTNAWDVKAKGHYYLMEKSSPKEVELIINNLMQHQPE